MDGQEHAKERRSKKGLAPNEEGTERRRLESRPGRLAKPLGQTPRRGGSGAQRPGIGQRRVQPQPSQRSGRFAQSERLWTAFGYTLGIGLRILMLPSST